MIETIIKAGLVAAAVAATLLMASAAHKQHVRKEFVAEIAARNVEIGRRDLAIEVAEKTIDTLKKAIIEHNLMIEAMEKSFTASRVSADRELATVRQKAKVLETRYAELEATVTPLVSLDTMTPYEITTELGECRRAVEINNAYASQGALN